MEIIPVIDLKGGIVVHAQAGLRDRYAPLKSFVTASTKLEDVIADILALFPFKTIYIADLDSISGQKLQSEQYERIVARFPDVCFWLDCGVTSLADIERVHDLMMLPVVGSETLTDLSILQSDMPFILSLDFKAGELLGLASLWQQETLWPQQVIAMNLDYVGMGQGPDYQLIKLIQQKKPSAAVIAAGGVRSSHDLISLANEQVSHVLVASAIHDGTFDRAILHNYPAGKNASGIEQSI